MKQKESRKQLGNVKVKMAAITAAGSHFFPETYAWTMYHAKR